MMSWSIYGIMNIMRYLFDVNKSTGIEWRNEISKVYASFNILFFKWYNSAILFFLIIIYFYENIVKVYINCRYYVNVKKMMFFQ